MTVCIAAIGNGGATIFGASDRMITAGDIEFEPPQQKIWRITPHIAMMVAEDVGLHSELYSQMYAVLQKKWESDASYRWRVRDVARIYQQALMTAHLERVEWDLLRPIGLTLSRFIAELKNLPPEFARQLADQLRRYPMPEVSAIFTGVDADNLCHIFVIEDGEMTCRDPIGFAAIGAGKDQANSHFMFARHTRFETGPKTLLRTYAAKKRAEVSPGVGRETDMFMIGGGFPYSEITLDLLQKLQEYYSQYDQGRAITEQTVYSEFDKFITEAFAQQQAAQASQQQAPQTEAPSPPQVPAKNVTAKKKAATKRKP